MHHQQEAVLLSLPQAGAALGYTKKGIEQRLNTRTGLIDFGRGLGLQTIKLGGQRLVHRAVLQKFLDDLAAPQPQPQAATPAATASRPGRPTKVEAARRRGLQGGAK
ncbi:hypothetical protein GALL_152090 [mine drainage metagenome]|uniref:Uncharacterized protein n=1 Tax=mine drainage metagenome TaxID=410659 RepID=A0A1J5S442_9ZZZZ